MLYTIENTVAMIKDRYHDTEEAVNRLVRDFYKHNNIIIAIDFDSVLFDFKGRGYSSSVRNLMYKLATLSIKREPPPQDKRFTTILFTAREGNELREAEEFCKYHRIRIDYVNESPEIIPFKTRKPFYNILLDDKAGLGQAYEVLTKFLKIIDYNQ